MKHGFCIIGGDKTSNEHLQRLLTNYPNYCCYGISQNPDDALNTILEHKPAIVFLDVDKKNGIKYPFNLVHELHQYLDELPVFIALSNSKNLAYEVIKNNFHDYLLKPLNIFELRKCLMKYEKINVGEKAQKICIRSYSDYRFVDLDDILFLKADNNTTDFFLVGNKRVTAYKTLKYFEAMLPLPFLRVHHSYIINTEKIVRINYGKSVITLRSDTSDIPFSRTYRSQVEKLKELYASTEV